MKRVKEINELFLITTLTAIVGSYVIGMTGLAKLDYSMLLLINQLLLALPTLVYIVVTKVSVKELFRFNKIKVGTVFLLILFAYLVMPFMQLINLLSMLIAKNEISGKITLITEGQPFIISLFVIAIVPAFLEESVYRGCFFNTYSKVSPMKAIVLSAFYFGLMHGNLNQFSYAFVMGMIFCLIVEATDSIFSSMIIHFVINGSSVVMLYVLPVIQRFAKDFGGADTSAFTTDISQVESRQLLITILFYAVYAVFATVLASLVFVAIVKHEGRWEQVKAMFRRKRKEEVEPPSLVRTELRSPAMYVAVGILLFYMIANEIAR